ncbi:VOC family protein [Kordiimonas lacus]|uniref:Catechol 2,3-dioxygenase n=1 Tax=Kordiimonas lacus TaxID=637679 RepID=A0A1G7CRA5_9PROT|nr:VOC family protein [Kordiimonas lacus]SDE41882.1 Catechol 2,3-dioxygenase [Kordiimonas lacus]
MIDHLSVGVSDIDLARKFYDTLLESLGITLLAATDQLLAYGSGAIEFIAMLPYDGASPTGGNGTHIAFRATSPEAVDAFHQVALATGGICEGAPGPRAYPHAEVYAAYVRDPFGNKLEALSGGFAG